MQCLDRPVRGLLLDCIVEERRRIFRVQCLGGGVLALGQARALLFVVGLAQIAPNQGIAWVQARGNLDLAASLLQTALAYPLQTETEPRQRIALIERDRLFE